MRALKGSAISVPESAVEPEIDHRPQLRIRLADDRLQLVRFKHLGSLSVPMLTQYGPTRLLERVAVPDADVKRRFSEVEQDPRTRNVTFEGLGSVSLSEVGPELLEVCR